VKTETKVILVVVAVFLGLELCARIFEPSLSSDVRNILAQEQIPVGISEVGEKGGTSVLVLGNSLARACLNEEVLEDELSRKGYPGPKVFFMTPDASAVNEWTAAYRKYFPERESGPDMVLIVTGPEHLLDHPVRSPEKMAAFHTAQRDRRRVLMDWLSGANPRMRFLLASRSRLFANRERIQPLLFYNFVPGFEGTARRINQSYGRGEVGAGTGNPTAKRFRFLLDSILLDSKQVFVIAAALPDTYRIPQAIRKIALNRSVSVIEEGTSIPWPSEAFPDGYHLGEQFSADFSREIAVRIEYSEN
jgi:hypothetical protein